MLNEEPIRTPVVDAAFFDPFLLGDEPVIWLRHLEAAMRRQLEVLRAASGEGTPTATLGDVEARLARFVDAPNGEMARAVRRPLWQLTPDSPARRGVSRVATQLLEDARVALELDGPFQTLVNSILALRAKYESSLPHLVAEHLSAAGLSLERLAHIRKLDDVRRAERRLGRLAEMLARLRDAGTAVTTDGSAPAFSAVEDDARLTLTEFRALRNISAKLRRRALRTAAVVDRLSYDTASGLLKVSAASVTSGLRRENETALCEGRKLTGLTASIIEDAAVRVFELGYRPGAPASAFWAGALSASARAISPGSSQFQWTPPLGRLAQALDSTPATVEHPVGPADGVVYCVPIGGEHVVLSTRLEGWVRVYTAVITTGNIVECVVAPPPAFVESGQFAETDIPPLFNGLDAIYPHWYSTTRRSRVRVLVRDGAEWYGRIEATGQITPVAHAPALVTPPTRGGASPFRVLRESPAVAAVGDTLDNTALTVRTTGDVRTVLGLVTRPVLTPFPGHPAALLRNPPGISHQTLQMVRREHALFRALWTHGAEPFSRIAAAEPVGLAQLESGKRLWPCYALPPGAWPPREALERQWVRGTTANLFAFLGAVARIVCAAHAAGFSLGVLSLEEFAVGVRWHRSTGRPLPAPHLMTAPLATPIGENYQTPAESVDEPQSDREYQMLGISVCPPDVMSGGAARAANDAQAFAAFALDLILETRITVPMAPLWDKVSDGLATVRHPIFTARHLAAVAAGLDISDGGERSMAALHAVAARGSNWESWFDIAGLPNPLL